MFSADIGHSISPNEEKQQLLLFLMNLRKGGFFVFSGNFENYNIFIFMLTRSQKEDLVKKLSEQIRTGKAAVFSDFTGTSVGNLQKLRSELRKSGLAYKVTKKKLIELAFKEAGVEVDVKNMQGQIGVAIGGEEEVAAAKILKNFTKENKNFKILQGVLEGKAISEKEVLSLAALPGKEELLAKLVGTINAPVSGFVNVLAGNLRNLVGVLKAIGESK